DVEQTGLKNTRVFNATLDDRNGRRMYAADNGAFWGTFLRYSDDFGETWQEPTQGIQFAEDSGLKLENIWIVQPGRRDDPKTVYAGIDPASLWVSTDGGETWDLNEGLANHPTRDRWGPGAGGLCLHSIVPDYSNPDRMWIGISAVGCMRTDDGGKTWTHVNRNTRMDFLPDKYPEYGQCIHRLIQHPANPDALYQQNHCGVYRTEDAGDSWTDIQSNLPSAFGFPIALDAHHPDTVFTIVEDDGRANVTDQFTVYRTDDGGNGWHELTNGLPKGPGVKLGVLRHGMCADTLDPCGVYVGTNTGQIFASADRGESWNLIADFLPQIYSVNVTVL
ncbi:MAG: exo-alpha-sialidase, partial [Chloroflexi bacterium]|nr:exo-alpha-sialidase [Chloroflexota bacterium]